MGILTRRIRRYRRLFIFLLITCFCFGNVSARDGRTLDMASLINSASKLLGFDMADGVANLVSAAFGQPPSRRGDPFEAHGTGSAQTDSQPLAPSLFTGLLKLVGLDPNKLGALALNAVIFVAQMVSNSLVGRPPTPVIRNPQMRYPSGPAMFPGYPPNPGHFRSNGGGATPKKDDDTEPEGTPLSWMLNSPLLKESNLLKTAQNPALAEQLEHVVKSRTARSIEGRSQELATPCIQQLVCRSAPFVWAMQRSLNDLLNPSQASSTAAQWNSLTPVQRMYAYLPAAAEVEERAKICREKLPACQATVL